MSEHCALCGAANPDWTHRPLMDWTQYLREERGMEPLVGAAVIPVCSDCDMRLDRLREEWRIRDRYPDEQREQTVEQVHAALDELDLDAIQGEFA